MRVGIWLARSPRPLESISSGHQVQQQIEAHSAYFPSPIPTLTQTSAITSQDHKTLAILDEILASKNDNDPRLDQDFNALTEGAKTLLREKYKSLAPEKLNEKGTIVFLLGRNITSERDIGFMRQVLSEPPCFSLTNCKEAPSGSEQSSEEAGINLTLAYPQIIALKQLSNAMGNPNAFQGSALEVLKSAQNSPIPLVSKISTQLVQRFSSLHD